MYSRKWIAVGVVGFVLAGLLLGGTILAARSEAGVSAGAGLQPAATDWSSGWVYIAPGQTLTFTHNVGGDPALYAVDLWFRDAERSPGLGTHVRAYGGMDVGGQKYGAFWHNLTDSAVSVTRMANDVAASMIRARIWIPDPPDYNSGWQTIAAGQILTFTHNVGGDIDDLTAGIKFSDTNPGGLGIHQYAFGSLEQGGHFQGAAWRHLTASTIQVFRFGADTRVGQVRVFVNQPDPPAYDSGWQTIAQGQVFTVPHGLGGNPDLYVVRGSAKSSLLGINTQAAGGLESAGQHFGSNWQGLTASDVRVFRQPHDLYADQVRVRVWRASPFSIYLPLVMNGFKP